MLIVVGIGKLVVPQLPEFGCCPYPTSLIWQPRYVPERATPSGFTPPAREKEGPVHSITVADFCIFRSKSVLIFV
jgi:hypothetical protein